MAVAGALDAPWRTIRVRALGTLELVDPERVTAVALRQGKVRRLLATLLVRAGSVVSSDVLADVVWGNSAPVHVEAALQTVMSRLRAMLRDVGLEGALLTRAPGYLMHLDDDAFDVSLFRRAAEEGRQLVAVDPQRAADVLDGGLALWRGPAFAEFADEDFAATEVANLMELRNVATEDRAEAALRLGRPDEAVAILERVVAESPLRERPQTQLMLALYRCGRQADALAVYRRFRDLVADQLGLHPSAPMRALETSILRQDPVLLVPGRPEAAEVTTLPPVDVRSSGNLPVVRTSLIGRAEETRMVRRLVIEGNVVTLTGPGGVGKTRLGVEVASTLDREGAFPDGVWLVELAATGATAPVARTVADVVAPERAEGESPLEALTDRLRARRVQIILDSCEHVVDEVAELVQHVVRTCPQVRVLATSRVPLGVLGERVVPLPPLSAVESVRLFAERAVALSPSFDVAPVLPVVEQLCRRLDGIPLAVELAAARMRFMTPEEVLACLPSSFSSMRNPYRLADERHRTLQAVAEWSYRLLDDQDRAFFEWLSVFRGPFSAEDVAAVRGGTPGEAVEQLGAFVDRSMVVAKSSAGQTRYSLLGSLRDFAADRLGERGDVPAAARAHAERIAAFLDEASAGYLTDSSGRWVRQVGERMEDVRAAFRSALDDAPAVALRLAAATGEWAMMGSPEGVEQWCFDAVARWRACGEPQARGLAARALATAAVLGASRGRTRLARAAVDEGLALLAPGAPERGLFQVPLAVLALYEGNHRRAREMAESAATASEREGDERFLAYAAVVRVLATARSGDHVEAVRVAEDLLRSASSVFSRAWACYALGEVLIDTDLTRACGLLEQADRLGRLHGDDLVSGHASTTRAVLLQRGAAENAPANLIEVLDRVSRTGNRIHQRRALRTAAAMLTELGDFPSAVTVVGALGSPVSAIEAAAEWLRGHDSGPDPALAPDELVASATRGCALSRPEIIGFARDALIKACGGAIAVRAS